MREVVRAPILQQKRPPTSRQLRNPIEKRIHRARIRTDASRRRCQRRIRDCSRRCAQSTARSDNRSSWRRPIYGRRHAGSNLFMPQSVESLSNGTRVDSLECGRIYRWIQRNRWFSRVRRRNTSPLL